MVTGNPKYSGTLLFSAILLSLFTFFSCEFLIPDSGRDPVKIEMDAQAIWDGDDALAIISMYTTTRSKMPFWADETARDWRYRVELWPDGERAEAVQLAVIKESGLGGAIMDIPIYWNKEKSVLSVADSEPYLIQLGAEPVKRIFLRPDASITRLADWNYFTEEIYARDLTAEDTVLSPDGDAVAVLYVFAYYLDERIGAPAYSNYILAFFSTADGSFKYARRLNKAPDDDSWGSPIGANA